jgi:hypothetical protein
MPCIVWIDRDQARLFSYKESPPSQQIFHLKGHIHDSLYPLLAKKLESASSILIVGPGVSKYRLSAYFRETTPQIARKVVACENLDQPLEYQLRTLAEKHLGVV